MFAYSARTNFYTEQLTTAILLANAKSEELAAQGLPNLPVGGGLDPASPVTSYCEYISVGSDGSVTVSNDQSMPFLRMWQISGNNPRLISVAVVAQASGISGDPVELIRTTTQVAN
jgi:hypothetical protein